MSLNRFVITTILALVGMTLTAPAIGATQAGRIIYAFGDVRAIDSGGSGRVLTKGAAINAGDTVVTTRGRAQIKFSDGGFAALQPDTEYRVDDYNFSGKVDGKERSFFNLVRGSVRLVTGLIGRSDRSSYRIRTAVATIGIRGTSGKLSHSDAGGTRLTGYGGTWDLESGSFKGPVRSGDSYACNGSTCVKLEGPIAQRRDVMPLLVEAPEEDRFTAGNQDCEGISCSVFEDLVVLTEQIGAQAFASSPGSTERLQDLAILFKGGLPVAGVNIDSGGEIAFATVDFEAVREAIQQFPDAEVVTIGNLILDSIDPQVRTTLAENPASAAVEDFATTADGFITYFRIQDGYFLNVDAFTDSLGRPQISANLRLLENWQSEHFIFGNDPLGPPAMDTSLIADGIGHYSLTGGTFTTNASGSAYGMGPQSGELMLNFALGTGGIDMAVEFDGAIYDINGSLLFDAFDPRFFYDDSVFATTGVETSLPVYLDGFVTALDDAGIPQAAGLAYVIDYPGDNILGTAAFGNVVFEENAFDTVFKYAFNYDEFGSLKAYADGDGLSSPGVSAQFGSLLSFVTGFGDAFTRGSATLADAGTNAATASEWGRWQQPAIAPTGWNISSPFVNPSATLLSSFHYIYTTEATPDDVVANLTGTRTFDVVVGGTPPTLNEFGFEDNSGALGTAQYTADFTMNNMIVNLNGNFTNSILNFSASGNGTLSSGFVPLTGTAGGSLVCSSSCALSGAAVFQLTGQNADGIISSYGLSDPGGVAISGTVALTQ